MPLVFKTTPFNVTMLYYNELNQLCINEFENFNQIFRLSLSKINLILLEVVKDICSFLESIQIRFLSAELFLFFQSFRPQCVIILMTKTSNTLLILLLIAIITHSQLSKCPAANPLVIASDTLTISSGGNIALQNGVDIQCYNYTLTTVFNCSPSVAISVNNLLSASSNNLFFSIKALSSDSNGVIPFIVRTQWSYTRWSRISFSFLAEASSQLDAGYYQVDTASLSACFSGKEIVAFIPFVSSTLKSPKALTFINGFEVSSVSVNTSYNTPFEVQLLSNNVTSQGITLVVSSTSATQVHSLFVSYVVYDPFIINLVVGSYVYNKYSPVLSLIFTPPIGVSNNNVAFHGLNGFIVSNNGGSFGLGASLSNGNINFVSLSNLYYLSYNYFFLIGGPCGQCVGYNINYNGSCVATCPPSSYFNGVTCIVCKTGDVWNGKQCITPAPVTPVNPVNPVNPKNVTDPTNPSIPANLITCPPGTYWDAQQLRCLACKTGCATCIDCYSCSSCSIGFFSPQGNPFCEQICGDGKRFILGCDDGNTVNGDGCNSTCQVQTGYFCSGGSSTSPDVCTRNIPKALQFSSSGQSRILGKILINVRVNYLPQALISSANDCKNNCKDILIGRFTSGDSSAISIISSYIPNSQFSFSVEVNFGKDPIGMFSLQIGLNPIIAAKYFAGVDTSAVLNVNVNPALFARKDSADTVV